MSLPSNIFYIHVQILQNTQVPTLNKNKMNEKLKIILNQKIETLKLKMININNKNEQEIINKEIEILLKELNSIDVVSAIQNDIIQKESDLRSTKESSQKGNVLCFLLRNDVVFVVFGCLFSLYHENIYIYIYMFNLTYI